MRTKILFVCTGNICRSPLAQAICEQEAKRIGALVEVESAGTQGYHRGENADPRMRQVAASHNYPFNHSAREFRTSDIDYYDYIIVMDKGHFGDIQRRSESLGKNTSTKLRMFREFDPQGSKNDDVPDPYYGGARGFEKVFEIVSRTVQEILKKLTTHGQL